MMGGGYPFLRSFCHVYPFLNYINFFENWHFFGLELIASTTELPKRIILKSISGEKNQ